MNSDTINKFFDKLGICVSGLCLVHCLIMPFALLSFPVLSNYFHHLEENIHLIFGVLVLTSAIFAVYPHCRKSGRKDILILALMGSITVLTAFTLAHEISEVLESILTVTGSVMLIIAHFRNMKVKHTKCEDLAQPCSNHH